MKKLIQFKKSCLGIITTGLLLINPIAWAQPVVKVPIGCKVVVTGTGTGVSPGFGGIVGNGGIVVMPDDLSMPGYTFTIQDNGTTVLNWTLRGDISFSSPLNPISQSMIASSSTPVDIWSFNKSVRNSEGIGSSNPVLARSKGRVSLSYDNTPCGGNIQFDIFKTYPNTGSGDGYVPPIVGPNCWLPDSTYTYSVDQIASDNLGDGIGIDEYYWTVYNGTTYISNFYESADKSSITLDAPNPVDAPWVITCCFGRANQWDGNSSGTHTTCVQKTIGGSPVAPTLVMSHCVNIGDITFPIIINPYDAAYNYEWSFSNPSWSYTQVNDLVTVSGLGEGPGIITLKVKNGDCSSVTITDTVRRKFVAPVKIAGDTCLSANGAYNYTIQPSGAQSNQTNWILPSGWTSSSNNNTNSDINISVPAGTPAGTYSIRAYSCASSSDYIELQVNVRPEDPQIVSGAGCIDHGDLTPLTYVVYPAGSYTWTIPAGWSGTSVNESITLTPNGTSTGIVTVTGAGFNGCNSLGSTSWNVSFNPVTPNAVISPSCWNFGYNANNTISIANAPYPFFGYYTVTESTGVLLNGYSMSPSGNGDIILNTSEAAIGSYTISVTHYSGNPICDTNATTVNFTITIGGNGVLLTPVLDPSPTGTDVYIVSNVPAGATFAWTINGAPIPTPVPPTLLGLNSSTPPPGPVCVYVTAGGCTTRKCATGGTHGRRPITVSNEIQEKTRVFPNPNDGKFTVEIGNFNQSAEMRIVDVQGREIGNYRLKSGQNSIQEKTLKAGSYFLLISIDEEVTAHKIEIGTR